MKKLLSVFTMLVLVMGVLAGCSSTKIDTTKTDSSSSEVLVTNKDKKEIKMREQFNHGYASQSKLWKHIPQQAAEY